MSNTTGLEPYQRFTKQDYLDSTGPYEYIYSFHKDRFKLLGELEKMCEHAATLKVRNIKARYKAYVESQKVNNNDIAFLKVTCFEGQPIELDSGKWNCDDGCVTVQNNYGVEEVVCPHPIMPVERLVNIDTGTEKMRIGFSRDGIWRYTVQDKSVLGDPAQLAKLADIGICVNRESARLLSDYFMEIESLNYEIIPVRQSVTRLGWIGEGFESFSPYCGHLDFDGESNFKSFFESVKSHGRLKDWLNMCTEIRGSKEIVVRIVLAASFASCLVKVVDALPFFVHLWGDTENGKTVSLMLAASVWANPAIGQYIHTFDSTSVGREMSASFVNSLPLILDELQISKNKKENFEEDIYKLTEGVGRTRSNRNLGINKLRTWANCIITSGEETITGGHSAGGAINRVLEIECTGKLFEDVQSVVKVCKVHYGHAGKAFVEGIQSTDINEIKETYEKYYQKLSKADTTEKQALAAALLLTADEYATRFIFKDNRALSISEIKHFVKTKAAVDVNLRAYRYVLDWIARNGDKFRGESFRDECWGVYDEGEEIFYIIGSVFRRAVEDARYSSTALLAWMSKNDMIKTRNNSRAATVGKRINKVLTECVAIKLSQGFEELDDVEDLPF